MDLLHHVAALAEPDMFIIDEVVSLSDCLPEDDRTDAKLEDAFLGSDREETLSRAFEEFQKGSSLYQCAICGENGSVSSPNFTCSIDFWHHVEHCHNIDVALYKSTYPNYCMKTSIKRCKICNLKVTHDRGKWLRHLKKKHDNISLYEYFTQHEFSKETPSTSTATSASEYLKETCDEISNTSGSTASIEEDANSFSEASNGALPPVDSQHEVSETKETTSNASESMLLDNQLQVEDRLSSCDNSASICVIANVQSIAPENIPIDPTAIADPDIQDEPEGVWIRAASRPANEAVLSHRFLNLLRLKEIRAKYNRCVFSCHLCHTFFDAFHSLVSHLEHRHAVDHPTHTANCGTPRVLENQLMCELCHNQLYCDAYLVQEHLLCVHGINLLQYDRLLSYSDDWFDTCAYRCRICKEAFGGEGKFKEHMAASHPGASVHKSMGVISQSTYDCGVCKAKVRGRHGDLDTHVAKRHDMTVRDFYMLLVRLLTHPGSVVYADDPTKAGDLGEWYNGCLFVCNLCKENLGGSDHLKRHVETKHDMSMAKFRAKHGLQRVRSPRYDCLVCGVKVIHDVSYIRDHVRIHNMTLEAYAMNFADEIASMPRLSNDEKLRAVKEAVSAKKRKFVMGPQAQQPATKKQRTGGGEPSGASSNQRNPQPAVPKEEAQSNLTAMPPLPVQPVPVLALGFPLPTTSPAANDATFEVIRTTMDGGFKVKLSRRGSADSESSNGAKEDSRAGVTLANSVGHTYTAKANDAPSHTYPGLAIPTASSTSSRNVVQFGASAALANSADHTYTAQANNDAPSHTYRGHAIPPASSTSNWNVVQFGASAALANSVDHTYTAKAENAPPASEATCRDPEMILAALVQAASVQPPNPKTNGHLNP